MQSTRALGVFALSAVILAAISFAAVDVTISGGPRDASVPVIAVLCAVIGTLSLIASVIPAITWFSRSIHHPVHDADIEPLPVTVMSSPFEDDEL